MRNEEKMVIVGLDGIIDALSDDKYSYKKWIISCFRNVFGSKIDFLSDEDILECSDEFGYTGLCHALLSENVDYEYIVLCYLEYVVGSVEFEEQVTGFIAESKRLFNNIIRYDDIINYIEDINKACLLGVVTDRCWFGCTLLDAMLSSSKYDYSQLSYVTRYKKTTVEAWHLVHLTTDLSRDNMFVVDTNPEVIKLVNKLGFESYLHKEGDLTGLSVAVNKFLSK